MKANQKSIIAAVALALGISSLPQAASAAPITFNWSGQFMMLTPGVNGFQNGALMENGVFPAGSTSRYLTPVTGTMTIDDVTGSGNATMAPFNYFNDPLSFTTTSMSLQAIGDGMGGSGNLIIGNMLSNWAADTGIPWSIVWDASGLLNALPAVKVSGGTITGVGVRPASDGTEVPIFDTRPGITNGYLDQGVVPLATTKYNTTPLCPPGGNNTGACMNVFPSAGLPLILDTSTNNFDYNTSFMTAAERDGVVWTNSPGVGGSPMPAGPFQGFSINLNISSLTVVPVPAAAWLFGSGLVGLIGATWRKRR